MKGFDFLSPPVIEIFVSPTTFTFAYESANLSLGTFLYYTIKDKKVSILSIGRDVTEAMDNSDTFKIHFFENIPSEEADKKAELLPEYIRYGLKTIKKVYFPIRPEVHIFGANSLAAVLNGYEKSVLKEASLKAGACKCFVVN